MKIYTNLGILALYRRNIFWYLAKKSLTLCIYHIGWRTFQKCATLNTQSSSICAMSYIFFFFSLLFRLARKTKMRTCMNSMTQRFLLLRVKKRSAKRRNNMFRFSTPIYFSRHSRLPICLR